MSWLAAGLAIVCAGCVDDVTFVYGDPVPTTAMSYNVANPTGILADNVAAQIADTAPDFVGMQECAECEQLVDQLDGYALTAEPRAGVAILYDEAVWELRDDDYLTLGDNDDGWGERVASWARFSHRETDHLVYVYSTHWCVSVRRPDDACDEARQREYAERLLQHIDGRAAAGAPVVLTGDFNVFDGFEAGLVVQDLIAGGLIDVFRVLNADGDGTTFQGNTWAPAGRIDYIFTTQPVEVLDSYIDRDAIAPGEGPDHYAVIATVLFGAPEAAD